jgi:glycosyltransferase involved in cell wall biosynthesis
MQNKRHSVCVIIYGLNQSNRVLQPWRYLTEVAIQLFKLGHAVTILTETGSHKTAMAEIGGVRVQQISSVRCFRWSKNPELYAAIDAIDPKVIIWSVGLTSFLHQQYPSLADRFQIGIFSSPIYSLSDLSRLGIFKLATNYSLSTVHVVGALSPGWLLKRGLRQNKLHHLVTQTKTTQKALSDRFWDGRSQVIPPAVDEIWFSARKIDSDKDIRQRFGFTPDHFVVMYCGSPAPLRGLQLLIRAIALAHQVRPEMRLLILNRRRIHELEKESLKFRKAIAKLGLQHVVKVVEGFLEPESLVAIASASDAIALPFELVPSDAPLSVLEARALRKPLITTDVACLPELVEGYQQGAYLAEPGNLSSLAEKLIQAAKDAAPAPKRVSSGNLPSRPWSQVGDDWSRLIESL